MAEAATSTEVGNLNDQMVEDNVLVIKNSKIGNVIPLSVSKITLRNLHLAILLVKTVFVVPTIMITYQSTSSEIANVLSYIFYLVLLLDLGVSYLEYYKLLKMPAIARIVSPALKLLTILAALMTIAIYLGTISYWFLALQYIIINGGVEVLYLFYSELDRIDGKHGLISSGIATEEKIGLLGTNEKAPNQAEVVENDTEKNKFTSGV